MSKTQNTGHRSRLKEKFLKADPSVFPDYELLELLLFYTIPRKDTKSLAKELINHFSSIANLLCSDPKVLQDLKVTSSTIILFKAIKEISSRLLRESIDPKSPIISSWKTLLDYCKISMGHLKTEQFRILYLNKKNSIIKEEILASGTIDHVYIYPREIVKNALFLDASAIILIHNHPSGKNEPSGGDIEVTKEMIRVCEPIGIKVHDHVIITSTSHYSFKAHGII